MVMLLYTSKVAPLLTLTVPVPTGPLIRAPTLPTVFAVLALKIPADTVVPPP